MGASTGYNKRRPISNASDFHISKRPRSSFTHQISNQTLASSNTTISRISRYPKAKITSKFRRQVHAPCRIVKFGLFMSKDSNFTLKNRSVGDDTNDQLSEKLDFAKRNAIGALRYLIKDKQVIDVDDEIKRGLKKKVVTEDSSCEEVEAIVNDVKIVKERSMVTSDGDIGLENTGKKLQSLVLDDDNEVDVSSLEAYKKLLESVERRNDRLQTLSSEIELNETRLSFYQSTRPVKEPEQIVQGIPEEPFIPLAEQEVAEVKRAFSANFRRKVLVTHKNSNIDITGEILRCLSPGAWLNDEVINVYLELLKERERREPHKFLKCHFFNTFFYKKLKSGNYKSVRRWTSERKLEYFLIDCDKIFVPVHREIHWCLAVVNKKDKKFQYLDSLKGRDLEVLETLAKYYVEEVKDKSKKVIDVSDWEREYVSDLPEQQNWYDCGLFMVKYADFYSRDIGLCFGQEHMPYFRMRIAKEILRLRAD